MIDHNNLEAAFPTIRRVNEKALAEYTAKALAYRTDRGDMYPFEFVAPFAHNPSNPDVEHGKWGSMLREAISAHL